MAYRISTPSTALSTPLTLLLLLSVLRRSQHVAIQQPGVFTPYALVWCSLSWHALLPFLPPPLFSQPLTNSFHLPSEFQQTLCCLVSSGSPRYPCSESLILLFIISDCGRRVPMFSTMRSPTLIMHSASLFPAPRLRTTCLFPYQVQGSILSVSQNLLL